MSTIANYLVKWSLKSGIIDPYQADIMRYYLEVLLSTAVTMIPLIVISFLISSPPIIISYFFTVFFLRHRTNGYHAESIWGCVIVSIICIFVFLGLIPRFIPLRYILLLLLIAESIIILMAPYNHPNMNYSSHELRLCKLSSWIRSGFAIVLVTIFIHFNFTSAATGIAMGIIQTAFLLFIAKTKKEKSQ